MKVYTKLHKSTMYHAKAGNVLDESAMLWLGKAHSIQEAMKLIEDSETKYRFCLIQKIETTFYQHYIDRQ